MRLSEIKPFATNLNSILDAVNYVMNREGIENEDIFRQALTPKEFLNYNLVTEQTFNPSNINSSLDNLEIILKPNPLIIDIWEPEFILLKNKRNITDFAVCICKSRNSASDPLFRYVYIKRGIYIQPDFCQPTFKISSTWSSGGGDEDSTSIDGLVSDILNKQAGNPKPSSKNPFILINNKKVYNTPVGAPGSLLNLLGEYSVSDLIKIGGNQLGDSKSAMPSKFFSDQLTILSHKFKDFEDNVDNLQGGYIDLNKIFSSDGKFLQMYKDADIEEENIFQIHGGIPHIRQTQSKRRRPKYHHITDVPLSMKYNLDFINSYNPKDMCEECKNNLTSSVFTISNIHSLQPKMMKYHSIKIMESEVPPLKRFMKTREIPQKIFKTNLTLYNILKKNKFSKDVSLDLDKQVFLYPGDLEGKTCPCCSENTTQVQGSIEVTGPHTTHGILPFKQEMVRFSPEDQKEPQYGEDIPTQKNTYQNYSELEEKEAGYVHSTQHGDVHFPLNSENWESIGNNRLSSEEYGNILSNRVVMISEKVIYNDRLEMPMEIYTDIKKEEEELINEFISEKISLGDF